MSWVTSMLPVDREDAEELKMISMHPGDMVQILMISEESCEKF